MNEAYYAGAGFGKILALGEVNWLDEDIGTRRAREKAITKAIVDLDWQEKEYLEAYAHWDAPALTLDEAIQTWEAKSYQLFDDQSNQRRSEPSPLMWVYLPPRPLDNELIETVFGEQVFPSTTSGDQIPPGILNMILPHLEELKDIEKRGAGDLPIGKDRSVFRKQDSRWFVTFDRKQVVLDDVAGMTYICYLLKGQGREFRPIDLARAREHKLPIAEVERTSFTPSLIGSLPDGVDLDEDDLYYTDSSDSEALADAKALKEYNGEIKRLRRRAADHRQQGRAEEAAKLLTEADKVEEYLRKITGLKDQVRKFDSPEERARKSVTNAIIRAKNSLQQVHEPLWCHFQAHLTTGDYCIYAPDPPIQWDF